MNFLFGNNTCTWVLILVIIFLLCNKCGGCGTAADDCGYARPTDCGCTNHYNGCGCL